MQTKPYLSIVVPIFNEEGNILKLDKEIKDSKDPICNR